MRAVLPNHPTAPEPVWPVAVRFHDRGDPCYFLRLIPIEKDHPGSPWHALFPFAFRSSLLSVQRFGGANVHDVQRN
jgi:hypothetical protein